MCSLLHLITCDVNERDRERETGRQRQGDKQAGRQTDRRKEKETDKQREVGTWMGVKRVGTESD